MTTVLLLALSLLQAEPAAAAKPVEAAPATPATAQAAQAAAGDTGTPVATQPEASPAAVAPAAQGDAPPPGAMAEAVPAAAEGAPATAAASGEPVAPPQAVASEPAATDATAATPLPPPPAAPPAPVDAAAAAPAAAATGACAAAPECECAKPKAPTRWGLTLDGGFPDAAGIALLYRPWYWLRLEAGGTTTVYASNGVRVGVSLVPFNFPITPALTFNYGRAFEADWNKLVAKFGTPDPELAPVLRRLGYQYVDAHVGLELGAPRRFVFFFRAGLTQLWTKVHDLTSAAAAQITDSTTSATISDTTITLRVPSVKVGFLIYFF